MANYTVSIIWECEVEADSDEDAIEKAEEKYDEEFFFPAEANATCHDEDDEEGEDS